MWLLQPLRVSCCAAIPLLQSFCRGCPCWGFSEPLPWAPAASAMVASHQPGEPQAFPAEAAHSQREERSRCWGCPGFLSGLPGTAVSSRGFLRFLPLPARCNPNLPSAAPLARSFPAAHRAVSVCSARGCLCLFAWQMPGRVQLDRASRAGRGWLPQ